MHVYDRRHLAGFDKPAALKLIEEQVPPHADDDTDVKRGLHMFDRKQKARARFTRHTNLSLVSDNSWMAEREARIERLREMYARMCGEPRRFPRV